MQIDSFVVLIYMRVLVSKLVDSFHYISNELLARKVKYVKLTPFMNDYRLTVYKELTQCEFES